MLSCVINASAVNEPLSIIRGTVRSSDNKPVANATVQVKNTDRATVTDKNGVFYFRKLESGTYTVVVSFVGSISVEQIVEVGNNETTDVSITINSSLQELEEIIIKSARNRYKVDELSSSLRLKTPILNIPQNIQVVTSDVLLDQQVFDVVDGITRNASGVVRQGHWDNQYANIRMRGSKLPAFRNGMNIEASWGPTAEDAITIDRIEFVKGPGSFMSAAGEPGGFYNVVTKKPTGQTKGLVNFSMGSFSTYRGGLDFDGKLSKDGKLLYRVAASAQQKDFFTKYNYSNRVAIAPSFKYLVDNKTSITLEYNYQGSKYLSNGNYTFSPKQYADPGIANNFAYFDPAMEPGKIRDHSAYLYFDHKLNDKWEAHAQIAYFNFNMKATSTWANYLTADGGMSRYYSMSDEAGENRFGQFSFSGVEHTGSVKHTILLGGDFSNKKFWGDFPTLKSELYFPDSVLFNVYNPRYGLPASQIPITDRSKSVYIRAAGGNYISVNTQASFFVHDELAFFKEKLRLSLGLRYTDIKTVGKTAAATQKDGVFSPRVGLSYSITKTAAVYALFDQTFVPAPGVDFFGNAFKPIRGNDIEGGIKKEWFAGRWMSTISVYNIKRQNALVPDPDASHVVGNQTFSIQAGETTSKGIEVDIVGEILPGLNLTANYAYTDSRITKASSTTASAATIGNRTTNVPYNVTNFWLQYRVQKGILEGFGVSGGIQSQTGRTMGTSKTTNFPDYFRADGGISYQKGRYAISMLVNNLLNHQRLMTAGSMTTPSAALAASKGAVPYYSYIVEARRNMRIGITYRF